MVLSMVLNSLLFVFRVRAVYLNSTKVTVIFGILWLTTLSQLLPPIASELNITDADLGHHFGGQISEIDIGVGKLRTSSNCFSPHALREVSKATQAEAFLDREETTQGVE